MRGRAAPPHPGICRVPPPGLPPTNFPIFTFKNLAWRTYLSSFTALYCFLFRFVCIKLFSLFWFLQIWVAICVYGTRINWFTLIKKLMQTNIVTVYGSILNVSTVHLNSIWHLLWRQLSKPVFRGTQWICSSKYLFFGHIFAEKCCWGKDNSGCQRGFEVIAAMGYLCGLLTTQDLNCALWNFPLSQVVGCRCTLLAGNSPISLPGSEEQINVFQKSPKMLKIVSENFIHLHTRP